MKSFELQATRVLPWVAGAVALHSLLLGSLLILRPFFVLELFDWPYTGTRFFPAQSGIFLLILGLVYAAAVRSPSYLWILVMSKAAAVLFLGGELLRGSCPPVVALQAGADGLMGAVVLALMLATRRGSVATASMERR